MRRAVSRITPKTRHEQHKVIWTIHRLGGNSATHKWLFYEGVKVMSFFNPPTTYHKTSHKN